VYFHNILLLVKKSGSAILKHDRQDIAYQQFLGKEIKVERKEKIKRIQRWIKKIKRIMKR